MKRRATQLQTTEKQTPLKRTRAQRTLAKRLLAMLKAGSDTRKTKVRKLRRSVRSSSYENDLKLTIAMERLARDLTA
jgi:hypothetical protein